MAMTLRLDDKDREALQKQAELEGNSMQETIKKAIRLYIDASAHRTEVFTAAQKVSDRHAEALSRLGE